MDGTKREDNYVSPFNKGSHNWQLRVVLVNETKPLSSVTVILKFESKMVNREFLLYSKFTNFTAGHSLF